MKLQKCLLIAATASLTLFAAACHDDDDASFTGPTTLKQFAVNDLDNRTTDTATPIEINDLVIDDSSEDPAQFDDVLLSS